MAAYWAHAQPRACPLRPHDAQLHTYEGVRDADNLTTIAAAMQYWDGAGRFEGLKGDDLSNYFKRSLKGTSKSKKKPNEGPPRWRSYSIVKVADLVLKHGVALRKALRLDDMEVDEVPTAYERAVAAKARVTELESEKSKKLAAMLAKAVDAKRKHWWTY